MAAEPEPLAAVKADPAIAITDDSAAIVLAPVEGETGDGLVFIPGAKVDPWAYAAKLSGIVESGTTVVITKPWLNLAFFDLRPLDAFTSLAPDVDTWAVGGHSLGGVPACQLTESAQALILFASYCANDLSTSGLPVLSLAGDLDGLSTPRRSRMPARCSRRVPTWSRSRAPRTHRSATTAPSRATAHRPSRMPT